MPCGTVLSLADVDEGDGIVNSEAGLQRGGLHGGWLQGESKGSPGELH